MDADSLSSGRCPTNNERRALKTNRSVNENFRSVCNSLESELKARKSDIDVSKARFMKKMKGKLPAVPHSPNNRRKTSVFGIGTMSDSLTTDINPRQEKATDFFLPRIKRNENIASQKSRFVNHKIQEKDFVSLYDTKLENATVGECDFDLDTLAFSFQDAKRARKISRSLNDLAGKPVEIQQQDPVQKFFNCGTRLRKISRSLPDHLQLHLVKALCNKNNNNNNNDNGKNELKGISNERERKHLQCLLQELELQNKVSANSTQRYRKLSKSLGDLESVVIAAAYKMEANAFLNLKLRSTNSLTCEDSEASKLHHRR